MIDDLPLFRNYEEPDDESDKILDYLMAHNKRFTTDFLKRKKLPFKGTKPELRGKLGEHLKKDKLKPSQLISLLDEIEGWGEQHIYFYSTDTNYSDSVKDLNNAKQMLVKGGLQKFLNVRKPLLLPDSRELVLVESSSTIFRMVWIEKREWDARIPDEDKQEGDKYWKAYESKVERGVTSFYWDLVTSTACIMIQRLPSGSDYNSVKYELMKDIRKVVDLSRFNPINISTAIKKLEPSPEVKDRQIAHMTSMGSIASFKSQERKKSIYDDPDLRNSRIALGNRISGYYGNFFFLKTRPHLKNEVHVKLYSKDDRIGIFGERYKSEVDYVLSRIKAHS